jgi:hypothetical protein
MEENKQRVKSMINILQLVAPGTPLREGIDNVLRAQTGSPKLETPTTSIPSGIVHPPKFFLGMIAR